MTRNSIALLFVVLVSSVFRPVISQADYVCLSGLPLSIPDNNAAGVTSSITISETAVIQDLNIDLSLSHSWVGDLIVKLKHVETGTEVALVDRMGVPNSSSGCSGNNLDVYLDDQGTGGAIESLCGSPTVPTSPPSYTTGVLGAFNGESIAGTWEVTVSDLASIDVGQLNDFCMEWNATDVFVNAQFPTSIIAAGSEFTYRLYFGNNGPYPTEQGNATEMTPSGAMLLEINQSSGTFEVYPGGFPLSLTALYSFPLIEAGQVETVELKAVTSAIRVVFGPLYDSTLVKVNSSSVPVPSEVPSYPINFDPALHPAVVTSDVVLVDDGDAAAAGGLTSDACQPLINGAQVSGKIALVDSILAPFPSYMGTPPPCAFSTAVSNALAAGAIGVILINVTDNAVPPFVSPPPPATGQPVPLVFIGKRFGDALKSGGNVSLSTGPAGVWEQSSQFYVAGPTPNLDSLNDFKYSLLLIGKDSDDDGTADAEDRCPSDGSKSNPGICGCGKVDSSVDLNKNSLADCNEAAGAVKPPAPKLKQKGSSLSATMPSADGAIYTVTFQVKKPGAKKAKKKVVSSTSNTVLLKKLTRGTVVTASYVVSYSGPSIATTAESNKKKITLK